MLPLTQGSISLNPQQTSDPARETRDRAEGLREQAAACRRLATNARTRAGTTSLDALGDHFDDQARKLDPSSQRR